MGKLDRQLRNDVDAQWEGNEEILMIQTPVPTIKPDGDTFYTMGTKGMADSHFCLSVIVTPQMVGKRIGVFGALERKTPNDRLQPHQRRYLSKVAELGGIAAVVRKGEDSKIAVEEWRRKMEG